MHAANARSAVSFFPFLYQNFVHNTIYSLVKVVFPRAKKQVSSTEFKKQFKIAFMNKFIITHSISEKIKETKLLF